MLGDLVIISFPVPCGIYTTSGAVEGSKPAGMPLTFLHSQTAYFHAFGLLPKNWSPTIAF